MSLVLSGGYMIPIITGNDTQPIISYSRLIVTLSVFVMEILTT